jgi:hypothetical protein
MSRREWLYLMRPVRLPHLGLTVTIGLPEDRVEIARPDLEGFLELLATAYAAMGGQELEIVALREARLDLPALAVSSGAGVEGFSVDRFVEVFRRWILQEREGL